MYVHGTIGMVRVAKATLCISSEKNRLYSAKRRVQSAAIREVQSIPYAESAQYRHRISPQRTGGEIAAPVQNRKADDRHTAGTAIIDFNVPYLPLSERSVRAPSFFGGGRQPSSASGRH